ERLAWRGGSLAKLGRLAGAASQVARAFRFLRTPRRSALALLQSGAVWAVQCAAVYTLLHAQFPHLAVGASLAYIAGVNLAAVISPTVGNVGSYQLAAVAVLSAYGVPAGEALVASVAIHALTL